MVRTYRRFRSVGDLLCVTWPWWRNRRLSWYLGIMRRCLSSSQSRHALRFPNHRCTEHKCWQAGKPDRYLSFAHHLRALTGGRGQGEACKIQVFAARSGHNSNWVSVLMPHLSPVFCSRARGDIRAPRWMAPRNCDCIMPLCFCCYSACGGPGLPRHHVRLAKGTRGNMRACRGRERPIRDHGRRAMVRRLLIMAIV